jgi:hypothetical protein
MNREELRKALVKAGIKEGMYSLDGPSRESESISLVEEAGNWLVLYKERGEFTQLGSYLSEEAACSYILKLFSEMFGTSIGGATS